jgi:hypothetical protein
MLGTQFYATSKEYQTASRSTNRDSHPTTLAAILNPAMKLQHMSYALAYLPIAITAFAIPTYNELNDICEAAGPNAVRIKLFLSNANILLTWIQYVAVKHANDVIKTYNYDECYPYSVDNSPAYLAVYCKDAYCTNCM